MSSTINVLMRLGVVSGMMQLHGYAICNNQIVDLEDIGGHNQQTTEEKEGEIEKEGPGGMQGRDHYFACPSVKQAACVSVFSGHAASTVPLKVFFNNVNVPHSQACLRSVFNCFWPVMPLLPCACFCLLCQCLYWLGFLLCIDGAHA